MARRGRSGDEIKKLVEERKAFALTQIVAENVYTPVRNFTLITISTHNALLDPLAGNALVFTAPRSAYYRFYLTGTAFINFDAAWPYGRQQTVNFELFKSPQTTPVFYDYLTPGLVCFKETAALTGCTFAPSIHTQATCFLSVGETVTIAARAITLMAGNDSVLLDGLRVVVEFLTDSRRLGSY